MYPFRGNGAYGTFVVRRRRRRPRLAGALSLARRAARIGAPSQRNREQTRERRERPKTLPTFQQIIARLQAFWEQQGCVVVQPYHTEVGAGTFNPATFLRCLDARPWRAAYVEPSMRPTDGRYGENPYRLGHYYQYQVVIKPSPPDIQDVYLQSLVALGIDLREHDVRFVEDNWEGPTLGAWGQGWEVWIDGMEATQFTYFQQLGGFDLDPITVELTYGLERLAMYLQGVDSVYDLVWSRWDEDGEHGDRHLRRRVPRERARVQPLQLRGRRHRDAVPPLPRVRGRGRTLPRRRVCRCPPTTTCSSAATPSTCSTRAA